VSGLVVVLLLASPAGWKAEEALAAPAKLNGCAVGDLDPARKGNEIVTVAATGEIFLVYRDGESWKHERIAKAPGEPIQCAIGDVDPAHPGNELVVVGMKAGEEKSDGPGAALVVRRDGDGWTSEVVLETQALIHGVCIGEFDPGRAGNEILCVGFPRTAVVLSRGKAVWTGELPGAGKTAVAFKGGAAVACQSGALVHVVQRDGTWYVGVLDRAPGGQARIATDGERVLTGRDDGALGLLANGKRADIHKEDQKLRGAVLADFDPRTPGIEAATAGYTGRVTVLHETGDGWKGKTVFTDSGKFHHLTAGELPGLGLALVGCGYSKRLTVITPDGG